MDDSPIHSPDAAPLSRRRMLALGAAGLAAASLGLPTGLGAALQPCTPLPPCDPGRPCTPVQALQALMDGNLRFVLGRPRPRPTLADAQRVAGKQKPFAAVLACADSRLPVEILFDQNFGDVFVCRSAGNVITSELVGSFEYGAEVLGTLLLMVLGHSSCGAVEAAFEHKPVPGQISSLFARIQPAVQRFPCDVDRAIAENVRNQVAMLSGTSPLLAERVRCGTLHVVGAVYNLATGRVTAVHPPAPCPTR